MQALQCRSGDHDDEELQRMLKDCELQETMGDDVQLEKQVRERDWIPLKRARFALASFIAGR